jgi:YbbR domain-containing protein
VRFLVNFLAQILCLILAVGIWLYIVQAEVDRETVRYTLTVELRGENELYVDTGREVLDQSLHTVDVAFTGTTRELASVKPEKLRVYADVSAAEEDGWNLCRLALECPGSEIEGVLTANSVMVYTEKLEKKTLPLRIEVTGLENSGNTATAEADVSEITVRAGLGVLEVLREAVVRVDASELDVGTHTVTDAVMVLRSIFEEDLMPDYTVLEPGVVTVTVTVAPEKTR